MSVSMTDPARSIDVHARYPGHLLGTVSLRVGALLGVLLFARRKEANKSIAAAFEGRTMPRVMPVAFRVAELTNQAAWPLLPGRVDAFRSTGLVGRYELERVPQGGAFTLTFGLEDAVRVKRTTQEELKRDTGLFNGNKRFTYAYTFEVANYGRAPVEVTLAETLPVSELNDIIVAVGEKTTAGYRLDPKDGIAKWKGALKAGEKKKVDLTFRVDVPNSYDTGGL